MTTPVSTRKKLPDPSGMIQNVRARLNPLCAVRLSPYCDYIISMAMQGIPFREIEQFLIDQGPEWRIASPTIWRNLKKTRMQVKLTYAEEMLANMGGVVKLDLVREMSQNIITQKQRVDALVRSEVQKRKDLGNPGYSDKRIRQEMQSMTEMMNALHRMLNDIPKDAADAIRRAAEDMEAQNVTLTEDAASTVADMILAGELTLGPSDLLQTKH